ncbi:MULTISPECIES: PLDc N-terminal domain-containing protein [Pseudomonadaceae]|uniref:PLDc N-terminal domain-containing protein n=1 Tax=Pseudomonadaceae TaxID=135621 RepID=UPI0015E40573|nr:PLD nuclease N-terminal domain-containing protein [Stutzerimonas stutzeri]MBA1278365.1 PLDc_N domain-containing protein [Stutzerimonas stutzeri]
MTDAFGGIFGLLILALDVWAIISVLRSDATTGKKAMWVLLIVILPVLGLIIWGIMGPRGNRPDDMNLRP